MRITKNNLEDAFKSKKKDIRKTAGKLGLEYLENIFADSSGFGAEGEMALTIGQFKKRIAELVEKHGSIYTYITSAGQFQVNVGVYIKK